MRRCVWSRNLGNEEAMAHWGLLQQKQLYFIAFKQYDSHATINFTPEQATKAQRGVEV